jgi:Undecaprenyl-phosphate galactose phosphotransferase WbaP
MAIHKTQASAVGQKEAARIEVYRGRSFFVILVLVLGDLTAWTLAFAAATEIRHLLIPLAGGVTPWLSFALMLRLNLIILTLAFALMGLYPGFGKTSVEEMQTVFRACTLGYIILGLTAYILKAGPLFSRSVYILAWGLTCLLTIAIRLVIRNRASLLHWWGTPVAVVGACQESEDVIGRMLSCRRMGLKPVLLFDEDDGIEGCIKGIPVIHTQNELESLAARYRIDSAVLVEGRSFNRDDFRQRMRMLSNLFPTVLIVLSDSPFGSLWIKTMDLEGKLTLQARYNLLNRSATVTKRVVDILLGGLFSLLSLPLALVIMLLIKLDSPGPIFYSQIRLGLGGKTLKYTKFRTMVMDSDRILERVLAENPAARKEYQTYHKLTRDPRVTRVGKLLRKFSLDEIPQFWDVVGGNLSLVGPRSYMKSELPDMGSSAEIILKIRPGLTGWWQIMGRHSTSFKQRLQLDEYYLSNWSLWLDIYILLKTVWVLVSGHGV